ELTPGDVRAGDDDARIARLERLDEARRRVAAELRIGRVEIGHDLHAAVLAMHVALDDAAEPVVLEIVQRDRLRGREEALQLIEVRRERLVPESVLDERGAQRRSDALRVERRRLPAAHGGDDLALALGRWKVVEDGLVGTDRPVRDERLEPLFDRLRSPR